MCWFWKCYSYNLVWFFLVPIFQTGQQTVNSLQFVLDSGTSMLLTDYDQNCWSCKSCLTIMLKTHATILCVKLTLTLNFEFDTLDFGLSTWSSAWHLTLHQDLSSCSWGWHWPGEHWVCVAVTAPSPRQAPADHAYHRPSARTGPGRQRPAWVALQGDKTRVVKGIQDLRDFYISLRYLTHSLILIAVSSSGTNLA